MRVEGQVDGQALPFPLPLQPPPVAWWLSQGEIDVKRPERIALTCPSGTVSVDFAHAAIDCSTSPTFNWEGIADCPRGRKLELHEVKTLAQAMPELGLGVDGATGSSLLYLAHGDAMHSLSVVSGEPDETARWDKLRPVIDRPAEGSSGDQPELGFGDIANRRQIYQWRLAMAVGWGFVAAAVGCCQLLGHLRPAFT